MNYNSTRNAALQVTAAQAIAQGISEEGGLFVPQSFPKADLNDMLGLDYIGRAEYVLSRFLTDFTPGRLKRAPKALTAAVSLTITPPHRSCLSINTAKINIF